MAGTLERRPGSWNRASLVIHSETLTPNEISEALAAKPTDSGLKGEPIGPRTPKPRETSFWSIEADLDDDFRIEDQIGCLLDFVREHSDALVQLISEGAQVRIQAAINDPSGQYPMTFEPEMLRLTEVPLTLWLTAWMGSASDKDAERA